MSPRIHLSLDNCFGIKRWVRPDQWMSVAHSLGFSVMEASTDNELDALYNPPDYLQDWVAEVKEAQERYGIRVASLFTGYQSYRTIGLAHHDSRVRQRILEGWFKPSFGIAAELSAAIGVYFHAFTNEVLQSAERYRETEAVVLQGLSQATTLAANAGNVVFCYEQMYAPHQTPWTIQGTREMLEAVKKQSGHPMYVALDVGHQVGQRRYLRPDSDAIRRAISDYAAKGSTDVWLGTDKARALAKEADGSSSDRVVAAIESDVAKHFYLFSEEDDGQTYRWIEDLACYSPIIHMQQTDGIRSHHAPFTPETNKTGIIEPKRLLQAIKMSYDQPVDPDMPPRTEDIYLAFEIFGSTADSADAIVDRLAMTLDYWRASVPSDGLTVDELLRI